MGRLFGTDGARGVAVTELTCETAMQIGRAAAQVLTKHKNHEGKAKILIGKDTRISSDVLEAALIAGITSVGVDVQLLGVVPTPAVAYLVTLHNADAGVMISASHNSVEYNGIKLFSGTGFKLPDSVEEEIEALILDAPGEIQLKNGCEIGRVSVMSEAAEEYIAHLESTADCCFDSLKVAIDCANGSASVTAEKLFTRLGAKCLMLSDKPDGCNINENCGSTHLEDLQRFVADNNCDLGVAFDGDADRCLAVDDSGSVVDGDRLIAVIADYMKEKETLKKDTAVVTVMSNLGFHTYMKEKGIKTVCTAVGDRYVLEEMLKNGYNIGGEQSGHIIFLDCATTGDGQLTAVQLMNLLVMRKKSLYRLTTAIPNFPQELVNIVITEDKKGIWDKNPAILKIIDEAKSALGDKGRVLVRESGTEPLVRVMIEGENAEAVEYWIGEICGVVEKELCPCEA
ncbi:MAG: phosphoglucosamine mutase [Firmicutes bacterium]|nr:phosphoglucosamine mutase [[Eubacterium] siraeum]MCM1488093.1 phosphoglucosamine mutase [Bacillota bacterium]